MKKLRLAACGGTFDRFHKGHKSFLRFALKVADKIIVAITSDNYQDFKREEIESFSIRKASVVSFLEKEQALSRVKIVTIDDLYGPTISKDSPIEAIVATTKTLKGAEKINSKRLEQGLSFIVILTCPLSKAADGKELSSSRIRSGEIDREGELYIHPSWLLQRRTLPEVLRQKLKKPLGILLKGESILKGLVPEKTITVGDVVTKTSNESLFNQKISVVDFYVGREKKFSDITDLGFLGTEEIISLANPAGSLTPELFKAAREIFIKPNNNRLIVKIEGEEDLAVLPFLLAAPLGFTILYGQPNEGVVRLDISEETKDDIRNIVFQFIS